jgi:hypothetical protein
LHAPVNRQSRAALQEPRAPLAEQFSPSKTRREKYPDDTPAQREQRRRIRWRYRQRKKKHSAKTYCRISQLEKFFADQYGAVLPDDDAGLDDIFVMANHLAHLDAPKARIRAWVQQWAPWYGERRTAKLIKTVICKPLKWTADKLAERVGLNDATRTRLGITTIGATDCKKAKRETRRKQRDAARHKALRARAGAKPQALSEARLKPWLALGISESTYRRRKRRDSDSSAACAKHIESGTNYCHHNVDQYSTSDAGCPPNAATLSRGAGARHNGASGGMSPPRRSLLWKQDSPRVFPEPRARGEKNTDPIFTEGRFTQWGLPPHM